MKVQIKKIIFLFIIMATVLLLPIIAFADESAQIRTEIDFGIENSAKAGRYLPVHIRYENTGKSDFDGNVSVFTRESDDKISEYRYEVAIKAGDVHEKVYYIPVGIRATGIFIKLNDNSGNTIIERDINLGIDVNNAKLFFGILSDTPEKLQYLDDISVNYGLIRTKTFDLDADSFASDPKGLNMLDAIVITNYTIRNLDAYQSHALMEWVRSGGTLILGTGERVDDTLGRYAPELLDDMYESPELCEIQLMGGPLSENSEEATAELYCVDVAIHGGDVISQNTGAPLLTSVNKENGNIVVAAYDLADVSEFAAGHSAYASDLITRCIGSEKLNALVNELYGSDNSEYESISSLVSSGDMDRTPPLGVYALSIMAFILLAGPGLYMFLRSRDISMFYRLGVLILSVGFTFIIFLMGNRTRFKDTFYNYAKIIDIDEDTVKETSFLNLRNPYNKSYGVNIIPGYTTYPVKTKAAVSRISEDWSKGFDVNTVIADSSSGTDVGISEAGAFTPQYFKLEKTGENVDGEGVYGYVSLFGNELDGYLMNACEYDLKDAALMFFGKMVILGDISAGETVGLSELKVLSVPLSESSEVAAIVTEDKEKISTMAFYRDYNMKGYTADARLVAFRDDGDGAGIITDADLNGRGLTLILSLVPVDSRSDDKLFRSVLVKNPTVISGTYDIKKNMMKVTESCIIEYMLGSDIELESLIIEWPDANIFRNAFNGRVSFYNYMTGDYDSIDTTRNVFLMDELEYYLSPSDTITIRYDYSGDSREYASLPMISVVGTDR